MNTLNIIILTLNIFFSIFNCQPPPRISTTSSSTTTTTPTTTTTSTTTTTTSTSTSTTTTSSTLPNIITKWRASNGVTGYKGYSANVQHVYYDSNYVYMNTNSIPSYTVASGGSSWSYNPNQATAQNVCFMFFFL